MSNSKLVNYTKLSPNCTKLRNHKIDKITIHHMAGNLTVETCGNVFASTSRRASSNYGIGSDGRVGMYVEECNRSWCSSNGENDHRAITIEVANDQIGGNWHVSDTALAKLIDLCVDVCQRNGIAKLNYTGDKSGNLTMHKWFTATACPGPYLESKFSYIAQQVNAKLNSQVQPSTPTSNTWYRVRKNWAEVSSQKGAFHSLKNAKACADVNRGYSVFDESGKVIYVPTGEKVASDVPFLARVTIPNLNIRKGAGTNTSKTGKYTGIGTFTIVKVRSGVGSNAGWGKLKSGAGWISLDYCTRV